MEGYVKSFFDHKGYGFITDGKVDYFVHYKDIKGTENRYRTLERGQNVRFDAEETDRGMRALNVEVMG